MLTVEIADIIPFVIKSEFKNLATSSGLALILENALSMFSWNKKKKKKIKYRKIGRN